jgi:hypothetical protein
VIFNSAFGLMLILRVAKVKEKNNGYLRLQLVVSIVSEAQTQHAGRQDT